MSPTPDELSKGRHRFHALCPYFAMFPESFAEKALAKYSEPGDFVLDPFCGRGTLPFQALLMRRRSIGCDVNPVAYCVTRAKTNAPALATLLKRLQSLQAAYQPAEYEEERRSLPQFFKVAFHAETLRQLLYLRASLDIRRSRTDCMVAALTLGSLHGESERSPMYLSNQMPHTISTKPDYSVRFWKERGLKAPRRDVFVLLARMARFRYKSDPPKGLAVVLEDDMRNLPRHDLPGPIRLAVTSPPYFNVTDYREDQWLRLWFLGHETSPDYRRQFRDDRHEKADRYWSLIADMWRVLGRVLAKRGTVVVRLGGLDREPSKLVDALEGTSTFSGRRVRLLTREVSEIARRQTDSFRPGSQGCRMEVDCVFSLN